MVATPTETAVDLADFIRENRDAILREWERFAAQLASAHQMSSEDLREIGRAHV